MSRKAKKTKSANGEGSVYEYPKGSGRWTAAVSLPGGSIKRQRAASKQDALNKLNRMLEQLAGSGDIEYRETPTLSEWCYLWLERYARNLKPNIREDYRSVVRLYIEAHSIGKRKIDKLTYVQVQDWVDQLSDRVSAQTVRGAHARLHRALEVAVKRRLLVTNPSDGIDLPSARPPQIRPLSFQQASALLQIVKGDRWAAIYHLAIITGMRQSEILGLTWQAIDFEKSQIRIYQQLRRIPTGGANEFALLSTKTVSSDRTLTLDGDMLNLLLWHQQNQLEEAKIAATWGNHLDLVFVTQSGKPIHMSNLLKHFKGLLIKAKLPDMRFHDLRHTAATLMLANSVPLATVSKVLGHSSIAVTAKIYAHALDESKTAAISGLSEKLRRG